MTDRVLVSEEGVRTLLIVSGPNGSKHTFFFFPDPDTPEEAQAQVPYQLTQQIFELGYESGWERDPYTSPLRYLVLPAVVLGIFLGILVGAALGTLAGIILGGVVCILLCTMILRHTDRIEAPINEDRRWFGPVREKLFAFAKANDFRGALGYAVDVTRCAA